MASLITLTVKEDGSMTRQKVTDPDLLSQLNQGSRQQVTDPALLAQLNDQQTQKPQEEQNLLQKVVRYGLQDPAIGLLKGGREFANIPHKISGGRIPEFSPSDYDFSAALGVETPTSTDKFVQGVGQYAPSMAIPGVGLGRAGQAVSKIPMVGKFASKALSEAIPQAGYAAAQAQPGDAIESGAEAGGTMVPFSVLSELMQGTNPIIRNVSKGGLGALGALIGREGAKQAGFGEFGSDVAGAFGGALGLRGHETTRERTGKLTEGVSPEMANPRLQAANRIGLDYLTPAEASLNPWTARREGALGKTAEGGRMLYERGMKRQGSERAAIEKTLDQIYSPEKMDKKISDAYSDLGPVNLPNEFPAQYEGNSIIKAAEKRVKNRPAYQESLKKMLPENVELAEGQSNAQPTSLVYWDHVKRALYDMEQEAARKGSGGESNILGDTRRDLVGQMDQHYPEYAEARGLYERKKTRQGLEKVFDQKEINGKNFYRALASEKKFDELLTHLKDAPEATQNLKDMRMLFKDIGGPPTIRTAKGTEERGMFQDRNPGKYLETLMEHVFTKGKNDKAAIEFITSKDWAKQMKAINKISDKQLKAAAIGMALSRGVAQTAGQSD
jgi:hypothetical protein